MKITVACVGFALLVGGCHSNHDEDRPARPPTAFGSKETLGDRQPTGAKTHKDATGQVAVDGVIYHMADGNFRYDSHRDEFHATEEKKAQKEWKNNKKDPVHNERRINGEFVEKYNAGKKDWITERQVKTYETKGGPGID
jgi:hypothetical protein